MKGKLIALEGIDGCGKDSQAERTISWLQKLGFDVKFSREPSDTPIGQTIRKMLRGEMPKIADAKEFQRLYVIDRAQDIVSTIKPRLDAGNICLMGRFTFSTVAYGMLDGISAEEIMEMHEQIIGAHLIWPDLNIIFDIPSKEALRRIEKGRDRKEFFEKEAWLEKIRQNYLQVAEHPRFKNSTVIIDASPDEEKIFQDVKKSIEPILRNK